MFLMITHYSPSKLNISLWINMFISTDGCVAVAASYLHGKIKYSLSEFNEENQSPRQVGKISGFHSE
jgi:hypothetical protein